MASVTALAYVLPLAVVLCGCGGGSSAPPRQAARPEPARPPEDRRPVIAAFGDSLTEGHGVDPSRSYPAELQRELDRLGYHYRVVNLGVSGDTSTDGVQRLSGVVALKPAFAILEFGANDGLRGLPVSQARANLARMIETLEQAGVRVILAGMTLPPNYGPDYIHRFEAMYHELAATYHVPLIRFLLRGVAGDSRYMQNDGLHPNAAGYNLVAANVLRALEPELQTAAKAQPGGAS
jgi:acyl-CoA thioesterase-1